MRLAVVTLFPEFVEAVTRYGVIARAVERALVQLALINPREFAGDRRRTVDDRPYGGGPGMVMLGEPLARAIAQARAELPGAQVYYLSPQGVPVTQVTVERLATAREVILVAGRYEGIDERVVEAHVDGELSVGDVVLSGGELAAMVIIDALVRLLPGALGDAESAAQDSFATGVLDHPHYTRPPSLPEGEVPAVLASGDHGRIQAWRRQQALLRTWLRRPDLLAQGLARSDWRLLRQALRARRASAADDAD